MASADGKRNIHTLIKVTLLLTFSTLIAACQDTANSSLKIPPSKTASNTQPRPTPSPTPNFTPPPATPTPPPQQTTPVATLTRSGEFLVSDSSNHNFNINFPISNVTSINKMVLDVDIYVSNWDPTNPGGYHCLFWLQRGTMPAPWVWERNTVGYMNLRGPDYNGGRILLETTVNSGYNNGHRYAAGTQKWYHLRYEFDAASGIVSYVWSSNGQAEYEEQINVAAMPIAVMNGGFFIEFGTQIADEGPEAKTYGWRFANLNLQAF